MLNAKRLTKQDRPETLGSFKPVGYVVIALPDDAKTSDACREIAQAGFADEDVLRFTAAEAQERIEHMLQHSSEFAGFGYEVSLMRRYQALSAEGCGWLMVFAPDEQKAQKVADIARRYGARMAVHYHTLVVEDLI